MKNKQKIMRVVGVILSIVIVVAMILSSIVVAVAAETDTVINTISEDVVVEPTVEQPVEQAVAIAEPTNETGMLVVNIEVPEEFYENIQVEVYDRNSGEITKIPVYAENEWDSKMSLPVGSYMVWNVRVPGDDINNPEWKFELGTKFEITNEGSTTLDIKCLNGVDVKQEVDTSAGVTNTDMNPEDLIPDDEIEEPQTIGGTFLDMIKGLVTGSNLFILIALLVCVIAYWIVKKKKEKEDM